MAKSTKTRVAELFNRKGSIEAQTKDLYRELDQIETELIGAIQDAADAKIKLRDGRSIELEDQFVDREGRPRNKAFKTAAFGRFRIVAKTAP